MNEGNSFVLSLMLSPFSARKKYRFFFHLETQEAFQSAKQLISHFTLKKTLLGFSFYCTRFPVKDNKKTTKLADIENFTGFCLLSLNTGMKFISPFKMKNPVREEYFMATLHHRQGPACDSCSFSVKLLVKRDD